MGRILPLLKTSQPNVNRDAFWKFSVRAAARTRLVRPEARGTLTAYDIDRLFVDQRWRCAISGIEFDPPEIGGGRPKPFTPSLDRIRAGGRYEVGNIRLVCGIVNFAMNEWGEAVLRRLVREMQLSGNRGKTP